MTGYKAPASTNYVLVIKRGFTRYQLIKIYITCIRNNENKHFFLCAITFTFIFIYSFDFIFEIVLPLEAQAGNLSFFH